MNYYGKIYTELCYILQEQVDMIEYDECLKKAKNIYLYECLCKLNNGCPCCNIVGEYLTKNHFISTKHIENDNMYINNVMWYICHILKNKYIDDSKRFFIDVNNNEYIKILEYYDDYIKCENFI